MSRAVVGAGQGAIRGRPLLPFGLGHILMTGQSTSIGHSATPVASTRPRHGNVQVCSISGAYTISPITLSDWSFRPLVAFPTDRQTTGGVTYPRNLWGESPDVAMADELTALCLKFGYRECMLATSCVGESGEPLSEIQKGGTGPAYAASMAELQIAHALSVGALGRTHGLVAKVLDHGQADSANAVYEAGVVTLNTNIDADAAAITGQTWVAPMIIAQQNSSPVSYPNENLSAKQQLDLCRGTPGTFLWGGTAYQHSFPLVDGIHFTTAQEILRGEYFARALFERLQGRQFIGLWPTSFSRSGNDVTIVFNVPLGGQLAIDTTIFPAPPHTYGQFSAWAAGMGIEAWHGGYGGTVVGISSLTVGAQSIVVHCTSQPDTIGYAHTPDTGGQGYPIGRYGCIRGSRAHQPGSISGVAQYPWCAEFLQAVA